MAERTLLERHDRLWERRSEVLRRWQELLAVWERQREQMSRQAVSGEAAVRRAAGGLTARQRRWAQEHSASYAARPTSHVGRQHLLTWLYRRDEIHAAESRAGEESASLAHTLAATAAELGYATRELRAIWGDEATAVTGQTPGRLRALARFAAPAD